MPRVPQLRDQMPYTLECGWNGVTSSPTPTKDHYVRATTTGNRWKLFVIEPFISWFAFIGSWSHVIYYFIAYANWLLRGNFHLHVTWLILCKDFFRPFTNGCGWFLRSLLGSHGITFWDIGIPTRFTSFAHVIDIYALMHCLPDLFEFLAMTF